MSFYQARTCFEQAAAQSRGPAIESLARGLGALIHELENELRDVVAKVEEAKRAARR